jgi:hypothetical protein
MPGITSDLQRQALRLCQRWQQYLPVPVAKFLGAAIDHPVVVPFFYLLPKVHKLPAISREHLHLLKGRPIATCHSWVTNAMSVWLADVLNTTCCEQCPDVLPDSKTLVQLLETTTVSRDAYLVTFDVESMYPSIDNTAAISACADTAALSRFHGGMVTDMLTFVMQHGFCQFNGQFYQQIKGTVMGTPVAAPPYSNIYIARCLESRAKQLSLYWPRIYKRFIDDGFFIWEQDESLLIAFLQMLNTLLPNIRLTYHYSPTGIGYMDLTITKCMDDADVPDVRLKITTYQKPHHQYMSQLSQAWSFQRFHQG